MEQESEKLSKMDNNNDDSHNISHDSSIQNDMSLNKLITGKIDLIQHLSKADDEKEINKKNQMEKVKFSSNSNNSNSNSKTNLNIVQLAKSESHIDKNNIKVNY